jgi:hypothetical protein
MDSSSYGIAEQRFMAQLDQIKSLKKFLFDEKVAFTAAQLPSIDLGDLNNFVYDAKGRVPSAEEWAMLDQKLAALTDLLTDALRWKIRVRELGFYFRNLPIAFLAASMGITIFYILFPYFFTNDSSPLRALYFLACLMLWTVAQGGLGACAFIGLSVASSNQPNATGLEAIDLTDRNTLGIRIVLGATFAFLIGGPISYLGLDSFRQLLMVSNAPSPDYKVYLFLLIPFIPGFSTKLVLALLNRFIDAIKAFFGVSA